MGVYIKRMEMPTSCYDCNCFIRDSDGSDYCCLLMQDIEGNNKRDDNCPLIPVPPHGRLIDADEMIRDIKKAVAPTEYIKNRNSNMIYFLQHQETVIPADPPKEET